MILSDQELRSVQAERSLVTPWNPDHLQPASIDLTLNGEVIRQCESQGTHKYWNDTHTLAPGAFILASTIETVSIPAHLVGQLNGRSSWARKGLIVHTTAGFIDPGFSGQLTLELKNVGHEALILHEGDRICQLVLVLMTSTAERPYGHPSLGSHYQGQRGTTPSVIF